MLLVGSKTLLVFLCFLDPRFKSLLLLPEAERNFMMSLVKEEVAEVRQPAAASEDATESTSTEGGPQKKKSKKGLFCLLEDLMDSPSVISGCQEISIFRCQPFR